MEFDVWWPEETDTIATQNAYTNVLHFTKGDVTTFKNPNWKSGVDMALPGFT